MPWITVRCTFCLLFIEHCFSLICKFFGLNKITPISLAISFSLATQTQCAVDLICFICSHVLVIRTICANLRGSGVTRFGAPQMKKLKALWLKRAPRGPPPQQKFFVTYLQAEAVAMIKKTAGLRLAKYGSLSELKVMLITSICNVLRNGRLSNLRWYADGACKVTVL